MASGRRIRTLKCRQWPSLSRRLTRSQPLLRPWVTVSALCTVSIGGKEARERQGLGGGPGPLSPTSVCQANRCEPMADLPLAARAGPTDRVSLPCLCKPPPRNGCRARRFALCKNLCKVKVGSSPKPKEGTTPRLAAQDVRDDLRGRYSVGRPLLLRIQFQHAY